MPIKPDQPFPKSPGDPIRSKDWNDAVNEIIRLDNAKANRAGDTFSGPLTVQGTLTAQADILAGNSSVHFTKVDHNWSALGDTLGYAAIENSSDYGTLMIVGRTLTTSPLHRSVSVWDELNVHGPLTVQGTLTTQADIQAGNSDLYFTKTDHAHTGFGNTLGYAAIENSTNYGTLMILGRSVTTNPLRRVVSVWDELNVNGPLTATSGGDFNGVTVGMVPPSAPGRQPPPAADFPFPYETIICNDVGHNLRLATVDALFFHTGYSVSPKALVDRNGLYQQSSSRELKESIASLAVDDAVAILDTLNPVEFVYKDDESHRRQLGFIAEETPTLFTSSDGKMVAVSGIVALLTRMVKEQGQRVDQLMAEVEQLRASSV